jgi:hypothetical protein
MPGEFEKDQIVEIAAKARPGYQATLTTLTPGPFVVVEIVGEGEKARATLRDGAGNTFRWFAVGDLRRSAATTIEQPNTGVQTMNATDLNTALTARLSRIAADHGLNLRTDVGKIAKLLGGPEDEALVERVREQAAGQSTTPAVTLSRSDHEVSLKSLEAEVRTELTARVAQRFELRVTALAASGLTTNDAMRRAAAEDTEAAEAYREHGLSRGELANAR